MIKPTVGRIVWFWDDSDQSLRWQVATVAYVYDGGGMVNLSINWRGRTFAKTSVAFVQDGEAPPPLGDYCAYQKRQAAEHDAEAKVARPAVVRHHEEDQLDK